MNTQPDRTARIMATFRVAVEEILGEAPEFDESTVIEMVGIDSLDLIEVGMIMEDEYGVEMTESDFEGVAVVGDVLAVFATLVDKLANK